MDVSSLSQFLSTLQHQKKYSTHTITNYNRDINQFLSYAKEGLNDSFNDVTKRTCKHYLYFLDAKNYVPSTIHRKISALRSYWRFMCKKNIVSANPWTQLILPKKPKLLPLTIDLTAMQKILDHIPPNSPLDIRNRTILELLFASGLRVSELANLKLNNINVTYNELKILGKGNKERIVFFGEEAKKRIQEYLLIARPELEKKPSDTVFISKTGAPIGSRTIQRLIKTVSTELNLNLDISPHTFRHSFATEMHQGGANLRTIQRLLGHESLSTTQIYTKVLPKKLLDTYRKFESESDSF
ncbi:tyrosine-type recombinase/integrase [bacterium]|jgi:site-specific recombinase XerD|nr:tyrosine-type recombinase/integrase [bacterium]